MTKRLRSGPPGLKLTLGFTLFYLTAIILIPIGAVFVVAAGASGEQFMHAALAPRTLASLKLTFGTALAAAAVNSVFGFLLAWSLVRYSFPGKSLVDMLVDLPFALPTAVAGIALTAIYSKNGWLGGALESIGIKVAFTPLGVLVALIFIGLPFVVRSLQPILEDLDIQYEEAAATLGASRWQSFWRVVAPALAPAALTGFTMAFARGIGEYGSVIFIAGNIPYVSEIAPLIIITKLEQYDYIGATVIAAVMLTVSFLLLLVINALQGKMAQQGSRLP